MKMKKTSQALLLGALATEFALAQDNKYFYQPGSSADYPSSLIFAGFDTGDVSKPVANSDVEGSAESKCIATGSDPVQFTS